MRFTYEVIIDIPHPAMTNGEHWSAELGRELRSAVARMSQITSDSLTQVREMGYKPSEPLTPGSWICGHCGKEEEGDPLLHQCPERIAAVDRTRDARPVEFSPETSSELVKTPGAQLEPGIEVDARFQKMLAEMKKRARYGRCAACAERIEISDDPIETHHIIMRHRAQDCKAQPAMKWSPEEYAQAIAEFEAQPHVIELKRRIATAHDEENRRADTRERNLLAKLRDSWERFRQEWRR